VARMLTQQQEFALQELSIVRREIRTYNTLRLGLYCLQATNIALLIMCAMAGRFWLSLLSCLPLVVIAIGMTYNQRVLKALDKSKHVLVMIAQGERAPR